MTSGTISILGCGWLGVPLARYFFKNGFTVKGSVATPEKLDLLSINGILPYQLVLTEKEVIVNDSSFFDCEVLIISIPPRHIDGIQQVFPAQIGQLIPLILMSGIEKVVFISSTSVYPEMLQLAREGDAFSPNTESGKALLLAEDLLRNQTDFKTTIIRFGGLVGADRNPVSSLVKSGRTVANAPVNLIHQKDCIGIISAIIEQEVWGETLNACCPEHPMKKDFYEKAARVSGLPEPQISAQVENFKLVDSSKVIRLLNYRFIFSNPMDFFDYPENLK